MNKRRSPDSIRHLMTGKSVKLAKLQQKASQLQVINQYLTNNLLPGSEDYCRVANLRQGTLVIEVASGAWNTRLQQLRMQFMTEIRRDIIPNLFTIEIKVNPDLFIKAEPPKDNPRKISQQTAEHLNTLAQHAPPALAKTLLRLAKLARRNE